MNQNTNQNNMIAASTETVAQTCLAKPKLGAGAQLMCAWPILLVAIGGAVGGLLGSAAYGLNLWIYRSNLPLPAKIALNITSGLSAAGVWLAVAMSIHSIL